MFNIIEVHYIRPSGDLLPLSIENDIVRVFNTVEVNYMYVQPSRDLPSPWINSDRLWVLYVSADDNGAHGSIEVTGYDVLETVVCEIEMPPDPVYRHALWCLQSWETEMQKC